MRLSMANVMRRFALGIDVGLNHLRVIVLSRRLIASAALRIEHMGVCALPANAVAGADFIDTEAIAAALANALINCRCKKALSAARVAMALPDTAILRHQTSIASLAPQRMLTTQSDAELDVLESAVLAQAEHLAGMEAAALAVDWFRVDSAGALDQLTIIVAPRRYIEARLEVAAQAGMMLHAIDGADAAALRACRFAATQTGQIDKCYGAIWLSEERGWFWLICKHSIEIEFKFISNDLAKPAFLAKLNEFVEIVQPVYTFIAGEVDRLLPAGRTVKKLSTTLRCPVVEFNPVACCRGNHCKRGSVHDNSEIQVSPSFAVAFGLALRWMI